AASPSAYVDIKKKTFLHAGKKVFWFLLFVAAFFVAPAFRVFQSRDIFCKEHRILSGFALACVIIQYLKGDFAEQGDDYEVEYSHEAHEQIGHVPDQLNLCQCTEHHH